MGTMDSKSHSILNIDCQRVTQNNVDFLVGKLKAHVLMDLSTVTTRTIVSFDDEGMPVYNKAIQRRPTPLRVDSIKEYLINDEFACFPSSILLSVPTGLISREIEDVENPILSIDLDKVDITSPDSPIYLQIFDGQHRFRGMQEALRELEYNGDYDKLNKLREFEFLISFFIEAEIEFQAMIFSTINRTPVKVSQDLVFDLFGLTKKDSPQKSALAIALQINGTKTVEGAPEILAPFYKRIRLLAKKAKGEFSPISQGMFIKTLVTLISPTLKKSEEERNYERPDLKAGGTERTIFRDFYVQGKDNLIFITLLNYFTAVKIVCVDVNGNSWWEPTETQDNPLQRTIGFLALIDLLIKVFPIAFAAKDLSVSYFKELIHPINRIKLLDEAGESLYPYSSVGKTELSQNLIALFTSQNLKG
jgi:DGQHR domain-containing protein